MFYSNSSFAGCGKRVLNLRRAVRAAAPISATFYATLCVVCATLMMAGCGTPHAVLDFNSPSHVTAGSAFTITVTAMIGSQRDTVINSRIHFTSSDPAAVLPGDYYFMPSDAGSHTWTNAFILNTPGAQSISGDIIDATGISGTASVTVQ